GTSYPAINSNDLKKIKINLPSLPEQTKIANFLSAIDTKIAQNTQSLEKMKTFKRGLLQQMFA
ncbi:MAG: restriction endonuclease subunit S, partial [Sulfurovum sp.]|nr:restriction endonuclease subunit S [Sulfurovum sp.]